MEQQYINNKIKGSLFAGILGDAIGSYYENKKTIDYISLTDFTWNISDDSQLTLATCESISNESKISPQHIAQNFVKWLNQGKLSGLGASTLKALKELQMGGHWALVGRKGEFAAGNGAAMRIAPLSFILNPENNINQRLTIQDICRITHQNDEAYVGALAVIFAIRYCLHNNEFNQSEYFNYIIEQIPDTKVRDRLITLSSLNDFDITYIGKEYGSSGYVVESVPLAIYAVSGINHFSHEEILLKLIKIQGDTDTNCSIFGQICGAYLGYDKLSFELLRKLQSTKDYPLIESIISDFTLAINEIRNR